MSKKTAIICGMMLSMFLLVSTSWALDFVPGQYEITSKVEMPGMPSSLPPQTVIQCMTKQEPVHTENVANQGCKVKNLTTKGDTISWEMECEQQGQKMKTTGQITYSGNTFQGTIKTSLGPQAGNMTITTVISGKRIGDCK